LKERLYLRLKTSCWILVHSASYSARFEGKIISASQNLVLGPGSLSLLQCPVPCKPLAASTRQLQGFALQWGSDPHQDRCGTLGQGCMQPQNVPDWSLALKWCTIHSTNQSSCICCFKASRPFESLALRPVPIWLTTSTSPGKCNGLHDDIQRN